MFQIADISTARLLRRNLGTILAEEACPVELFGEPAGNDDWPARQAVGEVDEPFADRLHSGDRFLLDGRCLEYRRKSGRTLLVDEVLGRPATPRWLGSAGPLSAELARRLYLLRVQAAEALRDGRAALARLLAQDYGLSEPAVRALAELFESQEQVSEIPEPGVCLVEVVANDLGTDCYLHTPLNRAANEALAWLALRRLTRQGRTALALPADLGLALSLRGAALCGDDLAALFSPAGFDEDLAQALEDSVALRERFRGTATVGLMLLRQPLGGRRRVGGRDWAERRLFERVRDLDADFVLLRQARRELRAERLDAAAALEFATSLPGQALRVRRLAVPSPLAESWTQLGVAAEHPTAEEALTRLHAELMGT